MAISYQKIIEPKKGLQLVDWKELYRYKDLLYFLVWRSIKVQYSQTVLGFAWALIRPFMSMIIFSFIFGNLADVPSDGIPYPIFSYVAIVPWTYFSSSMNASTSSIVGNSMLSKVYIPRLIFPLTPVLSNLVDFFIAFSMVGVLMLWFQIVPTWQIVFLPLLILLMMLTASGVGMWLSALAIQYRDVKYMMTFGTQLLMYAAPVVWPVSLIAERYPRLYLWYGLYPMAGVVEGFRSAILGGNPMPWPLIGMGTLSALLICLSGAFYFKFKERIFADIF